MIITKKVISRRAVLRGLGATVALPLLDSMVPALASARLNAARPRVRFAGIYVPNGISIGSWTPATTGSAFELSPTLTPLAPFQKQLLVLSGLANKEADAYVGEGAGDHSRGPASWLSGVHAKKTSGSDLQAGTTIDQIAAATLGAEVQLSSLELALESTEMLGSCDVGYSCAYQGTISWRTPTTPLPMENDPRAVFERMFGGDTTDPQRRRARLEKERSILDSVRTEVLGLRTQLGAKDRSRLTEYLDAVRDVERRIQKATDQSNRELPVTQRPEGMPSTFEEQAKLMFDLQLLAFQADLTRVITFMLGREVSNRTFPEIGVREPHHPLSHHQNSREKLDAKAKVDAYHVQMLAYFLDRLRSTADGDSSLFDQVVLLYGAGISDGDLHNHINLPVLLAGGGAGQLTGGRHLRYTENTPLANLHLSLLDKLGIPMERVGNSTGRLEL
jgi:hypothetical protein